MLWFLNRERELDLQHRTIVVPNLDCHSVAAISVSV
jgi:hypothetical protein